MHAVTNMTTKLETGSIYLFKKKEKKKKKDD